jgi:deaminated glutathione amidase
MSQKFIAACVQNCATPDVEADLGIIGRLIDAAAARGARFIALPEYCAGLDTKDGKLHPFALPEAQHPAIPAIAARARKHGAWILIGSIGVRAPDGRIFNRGLMVAPDGSVAARYDKLHLFDVDLDDGHVYRESATIAPGHEAVLAPCIGGPVGLSICYDLRFAALFRLLAKSGAQMLAIPAAFTKITGEAHWHVLNRARAIENGAYVIAPCQYGTLAGGSECFGHSLIVDPWGKVLADGGDHEGIVLAEIDLAQSTLARSRIPSLTHDRPFAIAHAAQAAE